jgi:hypothetical protein
MVKRYDQPAIGPGDIAKGRRDLPSWQSTGWNERQKKAAAARRAKAQKVRHGT